MKSENEDYYNELLDKFLSGSITKEESEELKVTANKNPDVQSKLRQHIEAKANIRIVGEVDLKKKLELAYDDLPTSISTESRKLNPYFRWVAVAASIIGLVFAFYYFSSSPSSSSPTFQLADYINEAPSMTIRGNQSNDFSDTWRSAESAYQDEKYKEAIETFDKLTQYENEAKAHAGKIAVFKGLSHLQLKEHDKAVEYFSLVSKSNPIAEDAKWYIALTYLDQGEKEKSKNLFQEIADDKTHYKHSQAIEILKQIDTWID